MTEPRATPAGDSWAKAWDAVKATAIEAGCTTDDVVLMLRILQENGGSMVPADLEREWNHRRGEAKFDG